MTDTEMTVEIIYSIEQCFLHIVRCISCVLVPA